MKSLEGNLLASAPFMPKVMLCKHSVCKAEEETKCKWNERTRISPLLSLGSSLGGVQVSETPLEAFLLNPLNCGQRKLGQWLMRNHGGHSPKGRGFSMQLCCTQRAQILLGISNRASGAQASDAQKWFHHKWLEKRRRLCNRQTLLCTEPEKLLFNLGRIASSLKCNPHGVTSKDEQGYYGHCHWGR